MWLSYLWSTTAYFLYTLMERRCADALWFNPLVSELKGSTFGHMKKPHDITWSLVTSWIFPICLVQIYFSPFSTLLCATKTELYGLYQSDFLAFCLTMSVQPKACTGEKLEGVKWERNISGFLVICVLWWTEDFLTDVFLY